MLSDEEYYYYFPEARKAKSGNGVVHKSAQAAKTRVAKEDGSTKLPPLKAIEPDPNESANAILDELKRLAVFSSKTEQHVSPRRKE